MAQPPPTADPLAERVRALADEVLADTDLFVVDVSVRGWSGSRVVEVFVDRFGDPGEGAGSDDLTQVSRRLAFLLDAEDPIDGKYRLDVSSPGIDRPLTDRRQYRRHVGRDLKVKTADGETLTGALVADGDETFTLETGDGAGREIAYADVAEARIQLPW